LRWVTVTSSCVEERTPETPPLERRGAQDDARRSGRFEAGFEGRPVDVHASNVAGLGTVLKNERTMVEQRERDA
jgi:hypothetical protein